MNKQNKFEGRRQILLFSSALEKSVSRFEKHIGGSTKRIWFSVGFKAAATYSLLQH
jgi:hypothetical protein